MEDTVGLRLRRRPAASDSIDTQDSAIPLPDIKDEPKEHDSRATRSTGRNREWTRRDTLVAGLVFVLAVLCRFYRLSRPNKVVFDEFHFGKWTNSILDNRFIFDLYPPLAKLLIAYGARFAGYTRDCFDFASLGADFPEECGVAGAAALRLVPATMGSLTVLLSYIAARLLSLSPISALLAAVLLLFDGMHIVISRIAMADAILICLSHASLVLALVAFRRYTAMQRKPALMALVGAGLFSGLALATKWTAIATPVLLVSIALFGIPPFLPDEPLPVADVAVLIGAMSLAYLGTFVWFFRVCNLSGGQADAFMSRKFQASLVNNMFHKDYVAPEPTNETVELTVPLSTIGKIRELNYRMMSHNRGVRGNSSTTATWYQWPLNWRGTLFFVEASSSGEGSFGRIFLLMNPFGSMVAVMCMAVFGIVIIILIRYRDQIHSAARRGMLPQITAGFAMQVTWVVAMLPSIVVYRAGPMYQYLPALVYAHLVCAILAEILSVRRARVVVVSVITVGTVMAFIFWAPWTYGLPLAHDGHRIRTWLPRWKA